MKDKYLIGLANLVNGSMLGYEDTSCVNDYKQWIEDYVNHSEQEIQSLKEVIKDLRKAIGRKEESHRDYYKINENNILVESEKIYSIDDLIK